MTQRHSLFQEFAKARNVQDVRDCAAPHLNAWASALREDFWGVTNANPGWDRLGWVDDGAFWNNVWTGVVSQSKGRGYNGHVVTTRIWPFLKLAGAAGNIAVFEEALKARAFPIVWQTMGLHSSFLDARVVAWLDAVAKEHKPVVGTTWSAADRQRKFWRQLPWNGHKSEIYPKGRDAREVLTLLAQAIEHGYCPPEAQLNAVGHIMAHAHQQLFNRKEGQPHLVDMMREQLGALLEPSIDLELVAMCSGYGPNTTPAQKGIKSLGRHFMDGGRGLEKKNPGAVEISVLRELYDLKNAQSLYAALVGKTVHHDVPKSVEGYSLPQGFDGLAGQG